MITDCHRLQAITLVVENAGNLDAGLNTSSLALKVEETLKKLKETKVGVMTSLERGKSFNGLHDFEAAVLNDLLEQWATGETEGHAPRRPPSGTSRPPKPGGPIHSREIDAKP